MKNRYRITIGSRILILLSVLLLSTLPVGANAKSKKTKKLPNIRLTSVSLPENSNEIIPGTNLIVDLSVYTERKYNQLKDKTIYVGFYLVEKDAVGQDTLNEAIYLGSGHLYTPNKGLSKVRTEIEIRESIAEFDGEYELFAMVDPFEELREKKNDNLFKSGLTITVNSDQMNEPNLRIAEFRANQQSTVLEDATENSIHGLLAIEPQFVDLEEVRIEFCLELPDQACEQVDVWNHDTKSYDSQFYLSSLEKNIPLATIFDVRIPEELVSDLYPRIGKSRGERFTLRATVTDSNNDILLDTPLEASAGQEITIYPPSHLSPYLDTDYGQEAKRQVDNIRRNLRLYRRAGKLPSALSVARTQKIQSNSNEFTTRGFSFSNPFKDINKKLKEQAKKLKEALSRIVKSQGQGSNSGSKETGKAKGKIKKFLGKDLKKILTGSRFNMPDGDFVWLQNIEVTAPPPPEEFKGKPYGSIALWERCIPFFCGPEDKKSQGKEPSLSCIRRYCGTTHADIRYGGTNTNLWEQQVGFEYDFDYKGFGFDLGLGTEFKIFKDQAINDYVASSLEGGGHFSVKVLNYKVPLFEAVAQAVASPTEIDESKTRFVLKIFGRAIDEDEVKTELGPLTPASVTAGYDKSAEVKVAGYKVEIKGEVGGTLGLDILIRASNQFDGLRGIIGPFARIGAKLTASTKVANAKLSLEGVLNLIEDRVDTNATMDIDIDTKKNTINPKLVFEVVNRLIGPRGKIDVKIKVDLVFGSVTGSVTLVSFETDEITKTLYKKTLSLGTINY